MGVFFSIYFDTRHMAIAKELIYNVVNTNSHNSLQVPISCRVTLLILEFQPNGGELRDECLPIGEG